MPVTNYYSVDSSILGSTRSGDRSQYLTDALGSVTAIVDSTGELQQVIRYKPYGDTLDSAGSMSDVKFTWNGSNGYRSDMNETYTRHRSYVMSLGVWSSADPLWPKEEAYQYVNNSPTTYNDYWGLEACIAPNYCCCCPHGIGLSSLEVINGKSRLLSSGERVGHYFELEYKLNPKRWNRSYNKGCTLEWWECSNSALPIPNNRTVPPLPAGQWHNMSGYGPFIKPFIGGITCDSGVHGYLVDEPTISKSNYLKYLKDGEAGVGRFLFIWIIVKPPEGCSCEPKFWGGVQFIGLPKPGNPIFSTGIDFLTSEEMGRNTVATMAQCNKDVPGVDGELGMSLGR